MASIARIAVAPRLSALRWRLRHLDAGCARAALSLQQLPADASQAQVDAKRHACTALATRRALVAAKIERLARTAAAS